MGGISEPKSQKQCVKLQKSIYGLVQATRAWQKKFTISLQNIEFQKCPSDNCLITRISEVGMVILCNYVNDVCCFGNKSNQANLIEL